MMGVHPKSGFRQPGLLFRLVCRCAFVYYKDVDSAEEELHLSRQSCLRGGHRLVGQRLQDPRRCRGAYPGVDNALC